MAIRYVYCVCPADAWANAEGKDEAFYSDTFAQDGFCIHAAYLPETLLDAANALHLSDPSPWVVLQMTKEALRKAGIVVRDVFAVGSNGDEKSASPRICGGVHPRVVDEVFPMVRDGSRFVAIERLVGAAGGGILKAPKRTSASSTKLIDAVLLQEFACQVFSYCGIDSAEAKIASDILVMADLRGIDSHGIARLPAYYSMLEAGLINPNPNVRIIHETASTCTVDGDNGLGLVVGPRALALATKKAKMCGAGFAAVRNTNHYGIAGAYSLRALEEGCIALSMTNSSPRVAPLWGKTRMLGTNPIACAFPGKSEKALVIDMATPCVPWGKIEEFARKEEELDPGWAIDENGLPDTSPENVLKSGALVGLGGSRAGGGHKGTCLGILVDIFCGVMSGGNWLNRVNTDWLSATERGSQSSNIGHFFGVWSTDAFQDAKTLKSTMDDYIRTFRASEPASSERPVLVPGDPEWAAHEERSQKGIPVKLSVLADLFDIAAATHITPPCNPADVDLADVKRVRVYRA